MLRKYDLLRIPIEEDDAAGLRQILDTDSDMRLQLQYKTEFNQDTELSPVHEAARYGRMELVNILLKEYNLHINAEVVWGNSARYTPLHWACTFNSNTDMVKMLVAEGADLKVPGQLGGLTGVPLEWGKELCRINVIERENQFRIIQDRGPTSGCYIFSKEEQQQNVAERLAEVFKKPTAPAPPCRLANQLCYYSRGQNTPQLNTQPSSLGTTPQRTPRRMTPQRTPQKQRQQQQQQNTAAAT